LTLIRRALDVLQIELILALSPQAKGRVERLFGTLQDRLIKEMRIAGICSLEQANGFLEEVFLPFWNERFTVEPLEAVDAHRPLDGEIDLLRLFAETKERSIRSDFTFRYPNQLFQIEQSQAEATLPQSRITIEHRLDGSTLFRWRDRSLQPTPVAAPVKKAPEVQPEQVQKNAAPPPPVRPIPPDHPWRKNPIRVGRGRLNPVVASAALRPDSPPPGRAEAISP
jgi:hypothetical protein